MRPSLAVLTVRAIDAAQPFDFEHRAKAKLDDEKRLKIGIVGFGTFGQFLAKRFLARGHKVLATSRTSYEQEARQMGVEFFQDPDDFCEEHPDVSVYVCVCVYALFLSGHAAALQLCMPAVYEQHAYRFVPDVVQPLACPK